MSYFFLLNYELIIWLIIYGWKNFELYSDKILIITNRSLNIVALR